MSTDYELKIAHGRETIELGVASESTVRQLKDSLQERTAAPARNMRLIYKGKTLEDNQTLRSAGLAGGSRLMLLSGGAPVASTVRHTNMCDGLPVTDVARVQGTAALAAARQARAPAAASPAAPPLAPGGAAARQAAWSKTGIVSLRDAGLLEVPCEVWQVGLARCLDLCGNPKLGVRGVGPQLAALTNLTRLHLAACGLLDTTVAWSALCSLSQLQTLLLDHNALTRLPESLGSLTLLKRLSVAHNMLIELPASMCKLSSLQLLDVSTNKLKSLPSDLGSCGALEELVLNQNSITALPASLAKCNGLKVLSADCNGIPCTGIPPPLLRVPSLHTFSLHGNPCTIEELREVDGYAELDARRRAKADKVVDGRVLGATKAFDEGADAARNRKF